MIKAVINRKYGGFGLSQKVLERLKEQGWTVGTFNQEHKPVDPNVDLLIRPIGTSYGYVTEGLLYINWWKHHENDETFRTRKEIVALVEELGEKANGEHALLEIVNVDDDYYWEIKNYDGVESIRYGQLKEED